MLVSTCQQLSDVAASWQSCCVVVAPSRIQNATRPCGVLLMQAIPSQFMKQTGLRRAAGSNDVNHRIPPAVIASRTKAIAEIIWSQHPCPIVYLSVMTAPQKRWDGLLTTVTELNQSIQQWAGQQPMLHYVDVNGAVDAAGAAGSRIYVDDGLHLAAAAYEAMGQSVLQALKDVLGRA